MNAMMCRAAGFVEFPKLFGGLKFSFDEEAFLGIRWYGLLIGLAVLLCVALAMKACRKYEIEPNDLLDYLLFSLPAAILGARIYYVVFSFDQYKDDLKRIFYYWEGGLAVYGGIIGAMIAVLCVAKYKKHSFLKLADFAMPYIFLGQAIGRWGNFFNQEAFGSVTKLPWGMTGDQIMDYLYRHNLPIDSLVHPTFFYESLWCFIGFAVILLYRRSRFKKTNGECVCLYMILYGFERMLVEGLRTDSLYLIGDNVQGGIRISQALSMVLFLFGIALFLILRSQYNRRQALEGAADAATTTGFENVIERLDQGEAQTDEPTEIAADDAADENGADT